MKYLSLILLAALAACSQPGQNRYGYQDVGQATALEFGTIVSVRKVDIQGQNTGTGALVGGLAGMGGGAYVGNGTGSLWAAAAGALAGAVIGGIAEQAASDHQGYEYVIVLKNGRTVSMVQNAVEGDEVLHKGQRVAVQESGSYMRVLPADSLPESIKRPKGIKIVD